MAERSVRRRGKADNEGGPRGPVHDWHPARELHVGPEPMSSTKEAGYTSAADSSARDTVCSTLDAREESIYTLVSLLRSYRVESVSQSASTTMAAKGHVALHLRAYPKSPARLNAIQAQAIWSMAS